MKATQTATLDQRLTQDQQLLAKVHFDTDRLETAKSQDQRSCITDSAIEARRTDLEAIDAGT